ncbi:MAG: ribosome biogenesis factor YjgA [Nannocystaceae bacterium]
MSGDEDEPGTDEPETDEPETSGAIEPETAEPETAEPDPAEPDPAKPDPAKPDPAKPDPGEPDPDDEDDGRTVRASSAERQAEAAALLGLAKSLVKMNLSKLAQVELPGEVREAVLVARGLGRSAQMRQIRRVSQLLRAYEVTELSDPARDPARKAKAELERKCEQWRERLVIGGDEVLTELVDAHPMIDSQRVRSLLRQSRRAPGSGKSSQALRNVLRLIREALQAEAAVSAATRPPER